MSLLSVSRIVSGDKNIGIGDITKGLPGVNVGGKEFDIEYPRTKQGLVSMLLKDFLKDNTDGLDVLGGVADEGYRPPEWGAGVATELVYCKTNVGGLFFDAVLSVSTEHEATITSHPVQNGANISDHMQTEPVTISMNIAMSDAMASMVPGQWEGAYTKSVSAYRILVQLQQARIPFSVLTRLNRYDNMVIQSITVDDDSRTMNGLRASINLKQVIMAEARETTVSARNWTSSGGANRGEVQPAEMPTSIAGSINGKTVNGNDTGRTIKDY